MMDTVAYLIGNVSTQDEIGAWVGVETRTEVFVSVGSISRSEWNSAGNAGLKPSLMVRTPVVNYNGQGEIEVDGIRYAVYRTYTDMEDYIELYCERKAGVGHGTEDGQH